MTAVQAIWIALLASLPFAVAGIVFAQDLLRLMGADAWTLTTATPTCSGRSAATRSSCCCS